MSETLEQKMRRIEAYCSHIERLAFRIPPPNPLCTEIVSAAISIQNIVHEVQAGHFADEPPATDDPMFAELDRPLPALKPPTP